MTSSDTFPPASPSPLAPFLFHFMPDVGFWQFSRPPIHSTKGSIWGTGLCTVLELQLFLCPVPNWFLKASQLPAAGVNPDLSWCQTWLVSLMLSASSSSRNEVLQQHDPHDHRPNTRSARGLQPWVDRWRYQTGRGHTETTGMETYCGLHVMPETIMFATEKPAFPRHKKEPLFCSVKMILCPWKALIF